MNGFISESGDAAVHKVSLDVSLTCRDSMGNATVLLLRSLSNQYSVLSSDQENQTS